MNKTTAELQFPMPKIDSYGYNDELTTKGEMLSIKMGSFDNDKSSLDRDHYIDFLRTISNHYPFLTIFGLRILLEIDIRQRLKKDGININKIRLSNMIDIMYEHAILSPHFCIEQFNTNADFSLTTLCQAVEDDQYGLVLTSADNTIDRLNELLENESLYNKIKEKYPDKMKKCPPAIQGCSKKLNDKKNGKLSTNEKLNIVVFRNRLCLEHVYDDKTPKHYKNSEYKILKDYLKLLNNASHGYFVEKETAIWAIDHMPNFFAALGSNKKS